MINRKLLAALALVVLSLAICAPRADAASFCEKHYPGNKDAQKLCLDSQFDACIGIAKWLEGFGVPVQTKTGCSFKSEPIVAAIGAGKVWAKFYGLCTKLMPVNLNGRWVCIQRRAKEAKDKGTKLD